MQRGMNAESIYLLLYFPFTLRGVNAESIYLLLYFPFTLRGVNAERVVSAALLPVYT